MPPPADQRPDESSGPPAFANDAQERLEALRGYDLRDPRLEAAVDRLTRIATDLFEVEVAFGAFPDANPPWLASTVNLNPAESRLAASVCAYTVRKDSLLVVENIADDERTRDRPHATEADLRFYAGVPIRATGGVPIGAFSIMDPEPRTLSETERRRLEDLAEMAGEELERRRDTRKHEALARRFEAVLQDPSMLVGVLSPDGTVQEANDTLLQYVGESREEVLGTAFWHVSWWAEETDTDVREWVRRAAGGEYVEYEADLAGPDGQGYCVEGTLRPAPGEAGEVEALVVSARDVTERKRQENELRVLSEAVGQANEAVLITEAEPIDEPGPRITYANAAFEEMSGWSEEEVLGKTPRVLQGARTERAVLDSLREALEAGEPWEGETVNYRKDGTPYWVQWNVAPVQNEEGTLERWVSVQRDVTKERERERKLRQSEERWRRLLEHLRSGVHVNVDGTIQYVNPAGADILGADDPQHVVGRDLREFVPDDKEVDLEERLKTLREGKPTEPIEQEIIRVDGTRRLVRVYSVPIEIGGRQGVQSVFRDITEERRAQRQLREREEELQRIRNRMELTLKETGSIVFEIDLETREVTRHGGFEAFFSASPEQLPMWDVFAEHVAHPDDREAFFSFYRSLERGEQTSGTLEYRTSPDTGAVRWIRDAVFVEEENGERRLRGLAQDVTREKEREQRLIEAKREAEAANRIKSTFLANMSHEIRTPLTSVIGFAEAIGEEADGEDGRTAQFAAMIEKGGRRLLETLDAVLQFSKLEAEKMALSFERVDLVEEAQETIEGFRAMARQAHVEVTIEAEAPVWAKADEGGLQIVLRNLVSNAIKYSAAGSGVWVRAWTAEKGAYLEVEDTGVGMDPDRVEDLLRPFQQESEGVARKYEGTGLGLALTKRVAEEMEGDIDVETEKGVGTTVTVRLPRPDAPTGSR